MPQGPPVSHQNTLAHVLPFLHLASLKTQCKYDFQRKLSQANIVCGNITNLTKFLRKIWEEALHFSIWKAFLFYGFTKYLRDGGTNVFLGVCNTQ